MKAAASPYTLYSRTTNTREPRAVNYELIKVEKAVPSPLTLLAPLCRYSHRIPVVVLHMVSP